MDYDHPGPRELSSFAFAMAHKELFDKYVEMRVHGFHSSVAFRSVFDRDWLDGGSPFLSFNAVDFNPYVIAKMRDAIAVVDVKKLWNPRVAVHSILELSRDPTAKDATRLAAMKELNVLLSITITDENGKTRASSMADFYKDVEQVEHKIPSPTQPEEEESK